MKLRAEFWDRMESDRSALAGLLKEEAAATDNSDGL